MPRSISNSSSRSIPKNKKKGKGKKKNQMAAISKDSKKISDVVGKRGRGQRKQKKKQDTFALYIYKVLKQVHPNVGVSRKAMSILNSFVNDCYDRITREASSLVKWQHKRTLSSREIQTSVKLNLPGELAKHAISEGNRAVQRYVNP